MLLRRSTLSLACAGTALALTAPAYAASTGVEDPVGDASGPGLDIVHVGIHNNDHRVVSQLFFDHDHRGDAIVSLKARDGGGVRVVFERRPAGTDAVSILAGAFKAPAPITCSGLKATWTAENSSVRIVMPSSCLDGGDYGAIRAAVLTETATGEDVDFAPETDAGGGHTAWIPRG